MPARSAGILIHRQSAAGREVLLVHPGGPFWKNKDVGAWQMPKGLVGPDEDDEAAARREVAEELGVEMTGPLTSLGEIKQAGGKMVVAFAAERDVDTATLVSNTIEIDWPPRSGRKLTIPEINEARWFDLKDAGRHILPSQQPLLDRLVELAIRSRLRLLDRAAKDRSKLLGYHWTYPGVGFAEKSGGAFRYVEATRVDLTGIATP